MKKQLLGLFVLTSILSSAWASETKHKKAIIDTNLGKIIVTLREDWAPKTVQNFEGLATGKKKWKNPKGVEVATPLYNGTIFHRVIKDFMIQGGDPLKNGTGGPGYAFEDEFNPDAKFDKPGKLAMANAGPGTNGSQFFITTVPTAWLEGKHTIFGEVKEGKDGMDTVKKIAAVKTLPGDRPEKDVVIKHITIE